ncbi:hypothetical protein BDV59DRAFT_5923 [Aspergillus ambiguus]|uniref:uncharacterized protein n=1 Tax=Aspergillus ambiguus TaxID=176160 RepID=UPI003CCC942E
MVGQTMTHQVPLSDAWNPGFSSLGGRTCFNLFHFCVPLWRIRRTAYSVQTKTDDASLANHCILTSSYVRVHVHVRVLGDLPPFVPRFLHILLVGGQSSPHGEGRGWRRRPTGLSACHPTVVAWVAICLCSTHRRKPSPAKDYIFHLNNGGQHFSLSLRRRMTSSERSTLSVPTALFEICGNMQVLAHWAHDHLLRESTRKYCRQ